MKDTPHDEEEQERNDDDIFLPHGKPPPPITGPYPGLAREVRYLNGWYKGSDRPYLSSRTIADRCLPSSTGAADGLSNGAANGLTLGRRVSPKKLKKYALAVGGDINRLLMLCDFLPLNGDPMDTLGRRLPLDLFERVDTWVYEPANDGTPATAYQPCGRVSDHLPEGIHAIEVVGPELEPIFHVGDIFFVREMSNPQPGQKVFAAVDGKIKPGIYHSDELGGYFSNLSDTSKTRTFKILSVIEYALTRA